MLCLRSTRRMVSDYVITEADAIARPRGGLQPSPPVSDPIAICWWPVDHHAARTVIHEDRSYNVGACIDYGNQEPVAIPYRSIVPKKSDRTNLVVPSALSSRYAGYGAVRLEWTVMGLGQSAGAPAVLALKESTAVQDVPYGKLAERILSLGQKLAPAD